MVLLDYLKKETMYYSVVFASLSILPNSNQRRSNRKKYMNLSIVGKVKGD